MRILVVEDEFLIAMEIEMVLGELGHEVVGIAANRAEAITLVTRKEPDLATVDLRLKDAESGEELARIFFEEHDIRAIFISGSLDTETCVRLEKFNPFGFVFKPLNQASLAQALADAEFSRTGDK